MCSINKYDFVQIMTIVIDKMKDFDDSQYVHNILIDFMEIDQNKIREKYNIINSYYYYSSIRDN